MNIISVTHFSKDKTVVFAAEELVRYLNRMGNIAMRSSNGGNILIGVYEELEIKTEITNFLDDEIYIEMKGLDGVISGPNPRSVLLSVYRYLTESGCHFLHPGIAGERIPIQPPALNCQIRERPSNRHRALSMEGSMKLENLLDMIDWLPKVGMNSFHTQLKDGYAFFERWYEHKYNPFKEAEPFDQLEAEKFMKKAVQEIKKRGLIYQAMGHGLTCEPFGLHGLSWNQVQYDAPEEIKPFLAEINGVREFWRGIPVNTNVCYSNPVVRKKIVEYIVDYCVHNPEVDLFHFWLADDVNNHCECKDCLKRRPTDWYVLMLNELDEALTSQGSQVKIVFLLFYELLWPPVLEEIHNQDRFVLLFAPLARRYNRPLHFSKEVAALPEFTRNHIYFTEHPEEDLAFLKAWRQKFTGDSFIYIYHHMTTGWEKDIAGYRLAKILHKDIQTYGELGLNGVSSCQTLRMFFPTGLAMNVLARTLWNDQIPFEVISSQYFEQAYGVEGQSVENFIAILSDLFDPDYLQMQIPRVSEEYESRFANIPSLIDSFLPVIEQHLTDPDVCVRTNWQYLHVFCQVAKECSDMFRLIAQGKREEVAKEHWPNFLTFLFQYEDLLQTVFDMEWFARNFKLYQVDESHFTNYDE